MSKRCEHCRYWIYAYGNHPERFGTCDHPTVPEKVILDLTDERESEEKVMHVHQNFGCIYHTPIHGNIVTKL